MHKTITAAVTVSPRTRPRTSPREPRRTDAPPGPHHATSSATRMPTAAATCEAATVDAPAPDTEVEPLTTPAQKAALSPSTAGRIKPGTLAAIARNRCQGVATTATAESLRLGPRSWRRRPTA